MVHRGGFCCVSGVGYSLRRGREREREDCLGTLLVLNSICIFCFFIDIISLCLKVLRVSEVVFVKKTYTYSRKNIFGDEIKNY